MRLGVGLHAKWPRSRRPCVHARHYPGLDRTVPASIGKSFVGTTNVPTDLAQPAKRRICTTRDVESCCTIAVARGRAVLSDLLGTLAANPFLN